jgi:hypothetical protein
MMTEQDATIDPVLGGIYEYCKTAKNKLLWKGNTEQNGIDLHQYEFEFHKKRSFLSEVLQTTDMSVKVIERYGVQYANPGEWFIPKYCVKTWSDWIADLPYLGSYQQGRNKHHNQQHQTVSPPTIHPQFIKQAQTQAHGHQEEGEIAEGFHRNEWNNQDGAQYQQYKFYNNYNQDTNSYVGKSRWELIEHVHFFTQKLFYQWKWNVRCAALRGEREVLLGVIPLYHENLIPFLFGVQFQDGSQVFHRYGLESVFHRVLRSLRREQFGLVLRAGSHEMVIRYSDIRVREERGNSWDSLIQEFLGLLRKQLPNHRLMDQRSLWANMSPGRVPGLILEWWVSWEEYWTMKNMASQVWTEQEEKEVQESKKREMKDENSSSQEEGGEDEDDDDIGWTEESLLAEDEPTLYDE